MSVYDEVQEYLVQFFFTEINEATPPTYTETAAKSCLSGLWPAESVESFWEAEGVAFMETLVQEYNARQQSGIPVFFVFLDDEGRKIRGHLHDQPNHLYSLFQRALFLLTDGEFERLSARILQFVGCELAYATPASHDQGIDGFGAKSLLSYQVTSADKSYLRAWILIQAKHYRKHRVSSKEIREFIGSRELAVKKIFSTHSDPYPTLELRPYSGISLVIVTSAEVKRTVYTMARKAGIVLITSFELCAIFASHCPAFKNLGNASPADMADILRRESTLVAVWGG